MNGVAPAFARAAAAAAAARAAAFARLRLPGQAPAAANPVRDDRNHLLIGGMIWLLIALMIIPEGFNYATLDLVEAPRAGGMISRLLWLALLGFGLLVIFSRAASAWLLTRWLNPFLLAFVVLAALSVTWSAEPAVTARRLIRVVTIVFAAMALALMAWHPRRFQNVVRPIITLMLVGSILFGLGWPELAIHDKASGLEGSWRGLANHKNGLGQIACLGLILWFHAWLARETRTVPMLIGSSLAITCLILSRSSTALVVAVFTMLFLTMLMRSPEALRRYMPWLVALFVAALLAYSLALLQVLPGVYTLLSPMAAITGKDMTFTGRTDIWDIMYDHIALHPLLGTGYGAYWTGIEPGRPSFDFVMRLNFYPGSAHNGYLDILNDLGAIGLMVLLGYLAIYLAHSLRLLKTDRYQAALYLALFLQQAITNLAESRWLSVFSVDFVIMTLATAALARDLLEQHLRLRSGQPQRPPHAAAFAPAVSGRVIPLPLPHGAARGAPRMPR